jgi:hypothetical protein
MIDVSLRKGMSLSNCATQLARLIAILLVSSDISTLSLFILLAL